MSVVSQGGAGRAPRPSGLADVLDVVLDKGIVIDAYVRVAVVGIELLTVDARVVIASVDTYLKFAEAVNRLDIAPQQEQVAGLPGMVREVTEGGAKHKTQGAIGGVKEAAKDVVQQLGEAVGQGDEKRGQTEQSHQTEQSRQTEQGSQTEQSRQPASGRTGPEERKPAPRDGGS